MLTEQQKTGYSVLRVKEQTRVRFEQLMQEANATTHDEMLTLLIERYTESREAEQQSDSRPS